MTKTTIQDCGEIEEVESPLDEPADIDLELLEYWQDRSELFAPPRNDNHGD